MSNVFQQFSSAFVNAMKAFRMTYAGRSDAPAFETYDARLVRYSLLWSMYENTAYQNIHVFADSYKSQYGLYRHTRGIYNPVLRLGDFWRSHLFAGQLDAEAGDGKEKPSALPILTDNESIRKSLAVLWRESNMQRLKDIVSLRTSIQGDGVMIVNDDPAKQRVSLSWVNPMFLKDVDLDGSGNVKGYVIEYNTDHPEHENRTVKYTEIAEREGEAVVYRTLLDDNLYAWDGVSAEWEVEYGFVPMVVFQHNNVGLKWGWSELQAGLPKFREVDDLASKTSDYIRKVVDAPMLYAGVRPPDETGATGLKITPRKSAGSEGGRDQIPAMYSTDANAKAIPIIANLDITSAVTHLDNLLEVIESDYPELRDNADEVTGDLSGRALRIQREPIENKVMMRRPDYDNAVIRIQQMALAIGGWRGYEGYKGFNLESFARGDLEHSIGERPVFAKDPLDDLERDGVLWDTANKAKAAGVPLPVFLKFQGWDEGKINEIINSEEYAMRMETQRLAVEGAKVAISQPPSRQPGRFGQAIKPEEK
jgi:hypothetical protein